MGRQRQRQRLTATQTRLLPDSRFKINDNNLHTNDWPIRLHGQALSKHGQDIKIFDSLQPRLQFTTQPILMRTRMPQLSITAFTKAAPALAGRKRQADEIDGYDSEEIQVASPKVRPALRTIPPAHVQNKRARVLDCVLIPTDKRLSSRSSPGIANVSSTRSLTTATPTQSVNAGSRPRRTAQRPVYDEVSEDEFSIPTAKPRSKKPVKQTMASESDFENDSAHLDSENDFADGNASEDSASIMSVDGGSDEDVKPLKKKSNLKTPQADAIPSGKKNATGRGRSNGAAGSSKNMLNIAGRDKEIGTGLDLSLPPLHKIDDIFNCIVEKAYALGFEKAVNHLQGRRLRVATMCSGTEAPFLAMEMIRKSLKHHYGADLMIEHAFSVEIVAAKQVSDDAHKPCCKIRLVTMTALLRHQLTYVQCWNRRVSIATSTDH